MKEADEFLEVYIHLLQCSVHIVQENVPFFHVISYLIHYTDRCVAMDFIIVAVLAEISIFFELLAVFFHAYVHRFIGRLNTLL